MNVNILKHYINQQANDANKGAVPLEVPSESGNVNPEDPASPSCPAPPEPSQEGPKIKRKKLAIIKPPPLSCTYFFMFSKINFLTLPVDTVTRPALRFSDIGGMAETLNVGKHFVFVSYSCCIYVCYYLALETTY